MHVKVIAFREKQEALRKRQAELDRQDRAEDLANLARLKPLVTAAEIARQKPYTTPRAVWVFLGLAMLTAAGLLWKLGLLR